MSSPTIALYGYWRGERFTSATRIVAMNDHWCWGALLPDNLYSAMVFADPGSVKHKGQSLDERYRRLIFESGLIVEDTQAELDCPTRACDATAYVDAELVGEDFIKVGEAGLALDPLSSTGVQKAVQSSLVASCSVHTILDRGDREAAREFYVADQLLTTRRHAEWARESYSEVSCRNPHEFWGKRARGPEIPKLAQASSSIGWERRIALSCGVSREITPCIVGDSIIRRSALCLPSIERPIAFLDGFDLPQLFADLRPGMTLGALAAAWPAKIPPGEARRIAQRCVALGLLCEIKDPHCNGAEC
jgi:hypothetical protein